MLRFQRTLKSLNQSPAKYYIILFVYKEPCANYLAKYTDAFASSESHYGIENYFPGSAESLEKNLEYSCASEAISIETGFCPLFIFTVYAILANEMNV